jgi:TRAP-type mannitol/chloroaromatic compound transport system permease small subunit
MLRWNLVCAIALAALYAVRSLAVVAVDLFYSQHKRA